MARPSPLLFSLSRSRSVAALALFGFCAWIDNAAAQSSTIGTGVVRHGLTVGGSNRVEGSLQILTGEAVIFDGAPVVTGDLLVPGTPIIRFDGGRNYGGAPQRRGRAPPTKYTNYGTGEHFLRPGKNPPATGVPPPGVPPPP